MIGRWQKFGLVAAFCATVGTSGCVLGYGPCLVLEPVKHTFTGRVHFHDYPESGGVDNVPILALDSTAYIYAPAQSTHCQSANDMQLVGVAEFPDNVGENSHVKVTGSVFEAVSSRHHTKFLVNVGSLEPVVPQR